MPYIETIAGRDFSFDVLEQIDHDYFCFLNLKQTQWQDYGEKNTRIVARCKLKYIKKNCGKYDEKQWDENMSISELCVFVSSLNLRQQVV